NRGDNGRQIFRQDDSAELFQQALAGACQRNGWNLYAYAILNNRYYLVIETPGGNLTEGMQWLQSAFSNRLNLKRRTRGHIFSGRYKAQIIEPNDNLLKAVDFVHNAAVRVNVCDYDYLEHYKYCSFHQYAKRGSMRPYLSCEKWLKHLGVFYEDVNRVWPMYRNYLMDVLEKNRQAGMHARRFLSGWVIGSKEFKKKMVAMLKEGNGIKDWGGSAMREINEIEWETLMEKCLERIDRTQDDVERDRKSADWKVAVAAYMKRKTGVSNPWLGRYLNMGAPAAVSRYVGSFVRGQPNQNREYASLRQMDRDDALAAAREAERTASSEVVFS
ncbi:MAG: hypothetical protein AAGB46_12630, partial [Verrucomicrobiota bacterium]